ncbi:MAG: glycoside hydrolase family 3 protein [Microbacterium sp.]|nr:glycoside hydrolase family 3 protein [Microbacterium sp.]
MRARRVLALTLAATVGVGVVALPTVNAPTALAGTTGVEPAATAPSGPDAMAEDMVAGMTTAQQAESVVMGHIPTTDPAALHDYMTQGLGGFILMGANIPASEPELQALTTALTVDPALPPLIAVDEEGGVVARLHDDVYPSARQLAALPPEATSGAFAGRGSLVARGGITVNFGTIADQTADPNSFISGRVLGTDPASAAQRVAAATSSQEQFVASTLKHFPGHGAAPGDSHHAIPSTDESLEQWRATDAVPFIAGIDAGASLLMFGHLAYTAVDAAPASLSARWHEIARDELGFDGVIVTDDLGMLQSSGIPAYADPVANAVSAIAAGNDLVLTIAGSTPDTARQLAAGIAAAVDSGAIPAERLADAATRVTALRLRIAATTAHWAPCPECEPAT